METNGRANRPLQPTSGAGAPRRLETVVSAARGLPAEAEGEGGAERQDVGPTPRRESDRVRLRQLMGLGQMYGRLVLGVGTSSRSGP